MSLIPLIVALSRVLQELLDMNIDELKQAHDLMKRIEATASLLPAYRKAETIVAAIPQTEAEKRSLRGTAGLPRHDEVTFTSDEIGGPDRQRLGAPHRNDDGGVTETLASKPAHDCTRLVSPLDSAYNNIDASSG